LSERDELAKIIPLEKQNRVLKCCIRIPDKLQQFPAAPLCRHLGNIKGYSQHRSADAQSGIIIAKPCLNDRCAKP
jgi:hypothetical protein